MLFFHPFRELIEGFFIQIQVSEVDDSSTVVEWFVEINLAGFVVDGGEFKEVFFG